MKHVIKPTSARLLAAVALLLPSLQSTAAETPAPVSIKIDIAAKGKAISPDLFGIFFEDLNYAADGGLYAELVQNRSFDYNPVDQFQWNQFTSWSREARKGAEGNLGIRSSKPLNARNPFYLSIHADNPGEGFGVSNAGYDGMPLKKGESYELSFFASQLFMGEPWSGNNDIIGKPMPVTLRLEAENGDVIAEAKDAVVGNEWTRYKVKLVPDRDEAKGKLVILVNAKGAVAMDEISLMPEDTFMGRKNGLRKDLAQALADLHPKFIRFPGGCLAHGDGVNNFYNWKDSVGPVEERKSNHNLWGYHQTLGLGYYEFFQFCEDIGAKPLPVLPAGVSCQNSGFTPGRGQQCVPMNDMPAYIQNVLDLIEWANGPVTSHWGAVRAAAGHPAPFGLKYIGIGNEDEISSGFELRFKMIQDAIRAKYPEIVIVGTVGPAPGGKNFEDGWAFARAIGTDTVDEHYYCPPDWFWENLHRYDNYDRKGPKVYAGEYAAHEPDRRNTLRAALAEAAGCIGFEENGDVVRFSSYAPLLARRGHTQWTPDMIYFTADKVYPSINYQVQKLFSNNGGDTLLPASLAGVAKDTRLAMSAVRDSKSGNVIVKVVNGSNAAIPSVLDLASLNKGRMTVTTLANADDTVANVDGQPPAVMPVVEESESGRRVERTFPAHSLTVIRLH
jgi:alpha-L-arabinofuranosidase